MSTHTTHIWIETDSGERLVEVELEGRSAGREPYANDELYILEARYADTQEEVKLTKEQEQEALKQARKEIYGNR